MPVWEAVAPIRDLADAWSAPRWLETKSRRSSMQLRWPISTDAQIRASSIHYDGEAKDV